MLPATRGNSAPFIMPWTGSEDGANPSTPPPHRATILSQTVSTASNCLQPVPSNRLPTSRLSLASMPFLTRWSATILSPSLLVLRPTPTLTTPRPKGMRKQTGYPVIGATFFFSRIKYITGPVKMEYSKNACVLSLVRSRQGGRISNKVK